MKEIELTQGKKAIIDDEDFEVISKNKWYYNNGYARRDKSVGGKQKAVFMHRVVINAPNGFQVDHINGNTLDNRKANLRLVTARQNRYNMRPKQMTSNYKGVSFSNRYKVWAASIKFDGKGKFIGFFEKETDAANAYNVFAKKHQGEFARLNDVPLNENWERTKYKKLKGGASKYFGVAWHRQRNKWRAYITVNGKRTHIGLFDTEIEAAKAFNKASVKYFGNKGYLNKLEE